MTPAETPPPDTDLAREFAAALDWWREAGVDHDYIDDATDWLATPEAPVEVKQAARPDAKAAPLAQPEPSEKKIGGAQENWPDTLADFRLWLSKNETIDEGGAFPIVAPRGNAQPELMVIVAEPEQQDQERLLSGPQGEVLDGIARAAGIGTDGLYVASALRRHTPVPDWSALKDAGLGELLLHHIGLVAPERLVLFGRSIPPLIGNDVAQGSANLQKINHHGGSIPVMCVGSLSELLRSASRRQRFWQHWLEWTER